jgi:hypothetical protein
MRWFKSWRQVEDETIPELNIDGVVADGLRDRAAARNSLQLLKREWESVQRRKRSLEKQSKRLNGAKMRSVMRSAGAGLVELGTMEMTSAMRDSSDPGGEAHLQAIEERLAEIERARVRLYSYLEGFS